MGARSKPPAGFRVLSLGARPGWSEDDPIMSMRLERDGWTRANGDSARTEHRHAAKLWISFDPPITWISFDPPITRQKIIGKAHRGKSLALRLRRHAIHETQGRWYVETADIIDQAGATVIDCGRVDWADLDHNCDVLFASNGALYRLATSPLKAGAKTPVPRVVADMNDMRFEPLAPPPKALKWT